jgi:hypothetical protein
MFLLSKTYWQVKQTKEKGRGVFAAKKIPSGTVIGDYLGTVIDMAQFDPADDEEHLFLMYFTDHACIYPDDRVPGVHLLNHSCKPNCWIYSYQGHTLFFSLRTIEPGEELTISYLLSPNDGTCKPCTHVCKCGSRFCTGSMHLSFESYVLWQTFLKNERKKTKSVPFRYGEILPKLPAYPETIPNNPIYAKIYSVSIPV